jgi:hypothetical protein
VAKDGGLCRLKAGESFPLMPFNLTLNLDRSLQGEAFRSSRNVKVNTLFILNIQPSEEETVAGSQALYERNRSKPCRTVVVEVDALLMGLQQTQPPPKYIQGTKDPPNDDNVGVYVVAHGTGNGIWGCDGERLAEIFTLLRIKKVTKLCILSCAIAEDKPGSSQSGGQASSQKRAIEEMCEELEPIHSDCDVFRQENEVTG